MIQGPDQGKEYTITDQSICSIGSGTDRRRGDMTLSEPGVGRNAAQVRLVGLEYSLEHGDGSVPVARRRAGMDVILDRRVRILPLRQGDEIVLGGTVLLVAELAVDVLIDVLREEDREVRVVVPTSALIPTDVEIPPTVPPTVLAGLIELSAHLPVCETLLDFQALLLRSVARAFPGTTHVAVALVAQKEGNYFIERSWALARSSSEKHGRLFAIPRRIVRETLERGEIRLFRDDFREDGEWVRSAMCAPLCERGGLILGLLDAEIRAETERPDYAEEAVPFFGLFAAHAANILALWLAREELETQAAIADRLRPTAEGYHFYGNMFQRMQGPLGELPEICARLSAGTPRPDAVRELRAACSDLDVVHKVVQAYKEAFQAASKPEIDPRPISCKELAGMMEEAGRIWQRLAAQDETDLGVRIVVSPEVEGTRLDPEHLRSVVSNLVSNAERAIARRADTERLQQRREGAPNKCSFRGDLALAATVEARGRQKYVAVYAGDNGLGMDERGKREFMGLRRPMNYSGPGMGLGRVLVRLVLRRWRGFMEYGSEPGQGTVVKCCFALDSSEEAPAGAPVGVEGRPKVRTTPSEIVELPLERLRREIQEIIGQRS